MSPGERSFGLQWRLALICLASAIGSSLVTLAVYWAGAYLETSETVRITVALGAGMAVGLAGAVSGSLITRSIKLRLWEAGRMAGLIARGDYRARLEAGSSDEISWLEIQLNNMAVQLETAVSSLRDLAEQNRHLAEEAGRGAALEERMRLARDLHDTVNQQLFVLAMRTAAVRRRLELAGFESAALEQEMNDLEALARQAHSQIRELILQLRPVTLEQEGLGAALKEFLKNAAEREGWRVNDQIDSSVNPGGLIGESLFRIAQEALNNISKHADAKEVKVILTREERAVRLIIADDGSGFETKGVVRPTALGLAGIHERAAAIGGLVKIISAPGQGSELSILVESETERSDSC